MSSPQINKEARSASLLIILMLLICGLLLAGCGSGQVNAADISAYAEEEILISGLADADFSVTISELAALDAVSRPATANRSNGEKVKVTAVGPLLDTFLSQYGATQTDFNRIRFAASDGYAITVDHNLLVNQEIILAVMDGSAALTTDDQPLRVVIPGERAMYWVRHLSAISFEQEQTAAACAHVLLLEGAVAGLKPVDYNYYGVTDQAVSLNELLSLALGGVCADDAVIGFYAADGLEQQQTWVDIQDGLLKISGADAPRLVGESLPAGMQFYDLVWLSCDDCRILCLSKAISLWGQDQRLSFYQLLNHLGGVSAEYYVFTDAADSSITYSVDQLEDADLFLDEQGWVVLQLANGSLCLDLVALEAAR